MAFGFLGVRASWFPNQPCICSELGNTEQFDKSDPQNGRGGLGLEEGPEPVGGVCLPSRCCDPAFPTEGGPGPALYLHGHTSFHLHGHTSSTSMDTHPAGPCAEAVQHPFVEGLLPASPLETVGTAESWKKNLPLWSLHSNGETKK